MERIETEGEHSTVTIPVLTDSDVTIASINGSTMNKLKDFKTSIILQTNNGSYALPLQLLNTDDITRQFGPYFNLEDVTLKIEVSHLNDKDLEEVEEAIEREGLSLITPVLNFKVSVEYKGKSIEIKQFSHYIKRTITLPENVTPNLITTGVVVEADGTIRHVPTQIVKNGNHYEAVINSLTNSVYALVYNPVQFVDVDNHWAENAVNNMGSRMVISGVGNGLFNPDAHITRAEFAAIVVRALGLPLSNASGTFADVNASDWYSSAVETAYAYGLINGVEKGKFHPNDKITREQAMLIISKAMELTGLSPNATSEVLNEFVDANLVSDWALQGVVDSIQAGVINGVSKDSLAPKQYITRAEVAIIIQRLLQKSSLIDG